MQADAAGKHVPCGLDCAWLRWHQHCTCTNDSCSGQAQSTRPHRPFKTPALQTALAGGDSSTIYESQSKVGRPLGPYPRGLQPSPLALNPTPTLLPGPVDLTPTSRTCSRVAWALIFIFVTCRHGWVVSHKQHIVHDVKLLSLVSLVSTARHSTSRHGLGTDLVHHITARHSTTQHGCRLVRHPDARHAVHAGGTDHWRFGRSSHRLKSYK
jgi:hypothetical protein